MGWCIRSRSYTRSDLIYRFKHECYETNISVSHTWYPAPGLSLVREGLAGTDAKEYYFGGTGLERSQADFRVAGQLLRPVAYGHGVDGSGPYQHRHQSGAASPMAADGRL